MGVLRLVGDALFLCFIVEVSSLEVVISRIYIRILLESTKTTVDA